MLPLHLSWYWGLVYTLHGSRHPSSYEEGPLSRTFRSVVAVGGKACKEGAGSHRPEGAAAETLRGADIVVTRPEDDMSKRN